METKQKNIPKIRFKGFSDEWAIDLVENVCNISTGKNNTQDKLEDGKYPFYVRSPIIEKSNKYLYDEEAVLTVGDGVGTGKVFHYVKGKYDLHQRVYRMFNFKVYGIYFYYFFSNNFHNRVMQMTAKTSVDSVRLEMISKMKIISPSIQEQTKIGEMFKNVDELISNQEKKCYKLQNIKKALLEKIFPKQGETIPPLRFKGFDDEWAEKKLSDVATFSKGKGLSWSDITETGKNLCIHYGHLYTDYGMVISKVLYKTNLTKEKMQRSKFGDVLIPGSDTTPTGLARASCIEKDNIILGGDINIITPNKSLIGSYLSYNININRSQLIKRIKGTTVKHLVNSDISSVEIFVSPYVAEQTKIGEMFKQLDNLISKQKMKLEKLKNIKKALLAKIFVA